MRPIFFAYLHIITNHFSQYNVTKEDFTVTVGKHHLRDNEIGQQVFGVSQVAYHPDYVIGRYIYDIALLRLNESIIFHDNVSPVCIPNPEQDAEGLVAATGWGSTQGKILKYQHLHNRIQYRGIK